MSHIRRSGKRKEIQRVNRKDGNTVRKARRYRKSCERTRKKHGM